MCWNESLTLEEFSHRYNITMGAIETLRKDSRKNRQAITVYRNNKIDNKLEGFKYILDFKYNYAVPQYDDF